MNIFGAVTLRTPRNKAKKRKNSCVLNVAEPEAAEVRAEIFDRANVAVRVYGRARERR